MRFFILRVTCCKKGRSAFGRNIVECKLKNKIIMNREIKFRGKSKTGKLIYGYLTQDADGALSISHSEFTGNYLNSVKKETVGQFTGFKDKNGKEIYEGDILSELVKTDEGLIQSNQQVFFHKKTGCWHLDLSSKQDKTYSTELWLELNDFQYEVSGNIHENKINLTHE